MPSPSHTGHVNGSTSLQLPVLETDSNASRGSINHDEERYKPHLVHSLASQMGYISPCAYGPQESQDIGALIVEEHNANAISMSSECSTKLTSVSGLPLSQRGIVRNSSDPESHIFHRPNSRTFQLPNDPRMPAPARVNTAPPDYSPPGFPLPLRTILPMSTASIQRWNRNVVVPTNVTHCLVNPLQLKFDDDNLPSGWVSYTHPEGAQYFFHEEKRIYTDANLRDAEEMLIVTESAAQILGQLDRVTREEDVELPPDVELVLEIVSLSNEMICGYYFVEHNSRCLFWLEEFDAEGICNEIKAVASLSHLRYEIESQYWTHWELFPNTRDLTPDLVYELRDIALHAAADTMTSRTSTALWNTEQNQIILSLTNNINLSSGKRRGYSACVVGRLMRNLTHNQFVHLYGQRGARLDRDQSVHGSIVNPRTLLVTVISPFLFWAPDAHLQSLEKIWVDHLVHRGPWTEFINGLNTEWHGITIIDIILLNANIAFLSISSVDGGGNKVQDRSAAQIFSYISTITALGCFVVSLLLIRQVKRHGTVSDASNFLGTMTRKTCGLEYLAILYALPYALLMWSTLSFLVAFMYTCFSSSSSVRSVLGGVTLLVVGVFAVPCIRTGSIDDSNKPYPQCLLRDNLGPRDSGRGMHVDIMYKVKVQDEVASPAEDEKEGRTRQQIWPLSLFLHKSRSAPPIQADNGDRVKVEV